MKILACLILLLWLITGLLLGVGGVTKLNSDEAIETINRRKEELIKQTIPPTTTSQGTSVANLYELLIANEHEGIAYFFTWTVNFPKFTALCITAMSFGLLGSVISLIKELIDKSVSPDSINFIAKPFLGILTGLVVLGISYMLPTILIKGASEIRPITLMFISLFCGIYIDKFYKKLESSFDKIISVK
ncbi:hypothetical protein [Pedobacter sp. L105]|uniref:hypothetical protein n=1 Tax=Pedobacter sp. L105 TaxID=1641871 RepID=UPI00131B14E3|nr:hypothetical protein [Pedobacter sp. L105]